MSLNLEDTTERLRGKVLAGEFPPGIKLREVAVAESLDVSRTIARLAMGALEHEGLLVREPNRGSRARSFTIDQIADAIEVRAELEAMAARTIAERGLPKEMAATLDEEIAIGEDLLARGVASEHQRAEWAAMNLRFHRLLVEASGNRALKMMVDQISALPLVSAAAIIFDRHDTAHGLRQLQRSHDDHVAIAAAIRKRQGHRAEALMREHALRSAENKRTNLTDPETLERARSLPGGSLIIG